MRPLSIVLDDPQESIQMGAVKQPDGEEDAPEIAMHPGTLEELQNVNCSTLEYPKLEPEEEKIVDKMIAALLKERDVKDKSDVKCHLDPKDISRVCKRTFEFFMLEPGELRLLRSGGIAEEWNGWNRADTDLDRETLLNIGACRVGLLRLNAPIKIVGDIHGQFLDLLRFLEIGGGFAWMK